MIHVTISSFNTYINFQESAVNTIPSPPKIQRNTIDWEKKILPTVNIILNTLYNDKNNENKYKTLFINTIENNSNNIPNVEHITSILIKTLKIIKNKCIIIELNTSHTQTYKYLKLLNTHLTSRSTTIKLARQIHAHYILYSIIYDTLDNTNLKMQLISVKNGEIICSNIIPILIKKNV